MYFRISDAYFLGLDRTWRYLQVDHTNQNFKIVLKRILCQEQNKYVKVKLRLTCYLFFILFKENKFCIHSLWGSFILQISSHSILRLGYKGHRNVTAALQSKMYTNFLTYLLTPWSRVLLEKLTGSAASQEIPRIFGTRRFITVLTSALQLSLSWADSIQSPQPPPTSWRSILILSSHLRLGLPNGLE